jgi:hypothetical protein
VRSDFLEDAALDSASKTTRAHSGGTHLARRDRSVLTCRGVHHPVDGLSHVGN